MSGEWRVESQESRVESREGNADSNLLILSLDSRLSTLDFLNEQTKSRLSTS